MKCGAFCEDSFLIFFAFINFNYFCKKSHHMYLTEFEHSSLYGTILLVTINKPLITTNKVQLKKLIFYTVVFFVLLFVLCLCSFLLLFICRFIMKRTENSSPKAQSKCENLSLIFFPIFTLPYFSAFIIIFHLKIFHLA